MSNPDVLGLIEASVVDRLIYRLEDDGRVHVSGVVGVGRRVVDELYRNGYVIVRRQMKAT